MHNFNSYITNLFLIEKIHYRPKIQNVGGSSFFRVMKHSKEEYYIESSI